MKKNHIAVSFTDIRHEAQASGLAHALNLPLVRPDNSENVRHYTYLLVITADYIGLHCPNDKYFKPFYIDFQSGKIHYRSKQAGLRNELLAKAIGAKPKDHPRLVDATAGLGRDSFILASLGFEITLLERSPILALMLANAMERAALCPELHEIMQRMHLIQTEAIDWLNAVSPQEKPDIIYLDPMFPERKKSSSVKKEMAILHNLLEKDDNDHHLLETALTCATTRVVVKRPRLAPTLSALTPSYSLKGQSSRFDIYLT